MNALLGKGVSGAAWVVESGDYEQRHVVMVAATPEAAVVAIKRMFASPYVVRWEDAAQDADGDWRLVGHFDAVVGYSTQHQSTFEITRYPIIDA